MLSYHLTVSLGLITFYFFQPYESNFSLFRNYRSKELQKHTIQMTPLCERCMYLAMYVYMCIMYVDVCMCVFINVCVCVLISFV